MTIICSECGGLPQIAIIAHPIWFKGTTIGLGKCDYEYVPWCPKDDPEPNYHGTPHYYEKSIEEYQLEQVRAFTRPQ